MPSDPIALDVRERRCPLWALALPGIYLAACLLAVRAALVDKIDVGISAVVVAVGLIPAFVIPAVFRERKARLELGPDGLTIDGRFEKVDDARLERAERGSAVLHLTMRTGRTRSFIVPSHKEAQRIVLFLPPVSAPALALTA